MKCSISVTPTPFPCFRAGSEMEVLDGVQLTTEEQSPFNNVATLLVFWFKHTHSQMLSVHTTKFCGQLFQELLGKASIL